MITISNYIIKFRYYQIYLFFGINMYCIIEKIYFLFYIHLLHGKYSSISSMDKII